MNWLEILIVALVVLWLVGTAVFLLRHKGKRCNGCCANCAGCAHRCNKENKMSDGQ